MAIQFREINPKTEDLMEQGNEAQNDVSTSKARVSQAQSDLNQALSELEQASQTDEDGNPAGDVSAAQARVNVARNQLAASKRAQAEAERRLETVNESKKSLAAEIKAHNDVERTNLSKLEALKRRAFADSSDALSEGIAERLNEAEEARERLLESLGIHDGSERVSGGGSGGGMQTWGSVLLEEIDTGEGMSGRSSSAGSEGLGGAVPLAMAPQGGFIPVPSDHNSNPARDMKRAFGFADRTYDRSSPEWQENGYRRVEALNGQIDNLDRRIEASRQRELEAEKLMRGYLLLDESNSVNDPAYRRLWEEHASRRNATAELQNQRRALTNERNNIQADLDPDRATTFRGFGGSDFAAAYDGIITSRQGRSVPGYKGTCGINGPVSLVNQQQGRRLDEKYGIELAKK